MPARNGTKPTAEKERPPYPPVPVVGLDGVERLVPPMRYEVVDEPWCEYRGEDGTVIRLKVSLTELVRHANGWAEDGSPAYAFRYTVASQVVAPPELRAPKARP